MRRFFGGVCMMIALCAVSCALTNSGEAIDPTGGIKKLRESSRHVEDENNYSVIKTRLGEIYHRLISSVSEFESESLEFGSIRYSRKDKSGVYFDVVVLIGDSVITALTATISNGRIELNGVSGVSNSEFVFLTDRKARELGLPKWRSLKGQNFVSGIVDHRGEYIELNGRELFSYVSIVFRGTVIGSNVKAILRSKY